MALLELRFVSGAQPELFETSSRLLPGSVFGAVRGKSSGAYRGFGTFQWTSAVKAVCVALLQAKVNAGRNEIAAISGERGSLAASLDYALSKEPTWLGEMFGFTSGGGLLARRLFLVSNPNRKRPGPVVIVLNERVLPSAEISVTLNGKILSTADELRGLLAGILGDARPQAAESCSSQPVAFAAVVNG